VYADDICLMAGTPQQLQALLDALASYCSILHMEISVAKTKVMIVAADASSPATFVCNGQPVEQVTSFKYLGLHFHQSGQVSHLIHPVKIKANGAWAQVQRRHSLLECGSSVSIHLHLLQAILVPALHYGCEVWGMHSPSGVAQHTREALQRCYDRYLGQITGVRKSTPSRLLLIELGLRPLQLFWWRQTLRFWNQLATSPVGSMYHTVLLDNVWDASVRGVHNVASSVASLLQPLGFHTGYAHGQVPVYDVPAIIEAARCQLQDCGDAALYCPRAAPSRGVVTCTYEQWFRPFSPRRRYCQLPVSGTRMRRFLRFRLGCHGLPIAAGRLASVPRHDRVCMCCTTGSLGDELHLVFECPALAGVRQEYAALFSSGITTMRGFFGQQDHIGVFKYIMQCLDFMDT